MNDAKFSLDTHTFRDNNITMPSTRSKKEALVEPLPAPVKRKRSASVETTTTVQQAVNADQEPAPKRKKAAKAAAAPPQTRRTTRASSRAASVTSDAESTTPAPAPTRRTTRAASRAASQMSDEEPAAPGPAPTSALPPFEPPIWATIEEDDEDSEDEARPKREPGQYPWQPWKPVTMKDHMFQINLMNQMKRMSEEEEAEKEAERQRQAQAERDKEEEERSKQARELVQEQVSAMGTHTPHSNMQATPKTGFFSRVVGAFTPFNGLRLWGTPATSTVQQPQQQTTPAPQSQPTASHAPQPTPHTQHLQAITVDAEAQPDTPIERSKAKRKRPADAEDQADEPVERPIVKRKRSVTPARRSQSRQQPVQQASQASPAPEPTPHTQHLRAITVDSQNNTPMERPTIKRKRSAMEDTGLDTISESPETSGLLGTATPSKPPVDLSNGGYVPRAAPRTPGTIPRARPIAKTRAALNARLAALTPTFQRYAPPTPRDPNADRRILRVREIEHLRARQKRDEEELARLEAERAADMPRKTKRVKVDHLKVIPHNRPGDSEGSFRVPDWDSDEEMEVDEDAELIDNLFDKNEEDKQMTEHPPSNTQTSTATVASESAAAAVPSPQRNNAQTSAATVTNKTAASVPLPQQTNTPQTSAAIVTSGSNAGVPSPPQLISDKSDEEEESDIEFDWPALPAKEDSGAVFAAKEDAEECFKRGLEHFVKTKEALEDY